MALIFYYRIMLHFKCKLTVSVDLELEVSKRRNRFIKKTVTIPEYLNILGVRNNLNFSQILAEGLREKLKIK